MAFFLLFINWGSVAYRWERSNYRKYTMNRQKGLTMLELMTVIAMIAVLAALALPNLDAVIANMRLKSATQDLYSLLQQTRMTAVRTNSQWAVVFQTSEYRMVDCVDNDCATTDDNVIVKTVDMSAYPGVVMTHTFGSSRVAFTSEGRSEPSGGTITFKNSKLKTSTIDISAAGRIRCP